jgi:hypothetical protein
MNPKDAVLCVWCEWTLIMSTSPLVEMFSLESSECPYFMGSCLAISPKLLAPELNHSLLLTFWALLYPLQLPLPPSFFSFCIPVKLPIPYFPLILPGLGPMARQAWQPHSNSIQLPKEDFTFGFESWCMCICIWYFLFQLFLSCYQRFHVDCGNFIDLVWHFEDKFLHLKSS